MAAGCSTRFDGVKQLAKTGGIPMLQRSINNICETVCEEYVVVLGHQAGHIRQALALPEGFRSIVAKDWQKGLGHSIASACQLLSGQATHIMITLADQVAITAQDYQLLVEHSRNNPAEIICCGYGGKQGVPAIFPARYRSALQTLSGDTGAKSLLQQSNVISVPMPGAAQDIDTQEHLKFWQQATQDQQ